MRRILICLLLCLAIPVQGFAGMVLHANACPMQTATSGVAAEACPMKHCCNDAETYGKTGKVCKAEQQCQAGYQFPNALPAIQSSIAPKSMSIAHVARFVPALDPSGIWRPPA